MTKFEHSPVTQAKTETSLTQDSGKLRIPRVPSATVVTDNAAVLAQLGVTISPNRPSSVPAGISKGLGISTEPQMGAYLCAPTLQASKEPVKLPQNHQEVIRFNLGPLRAS